MAHRSKWFILTGLGISLVIWLFNVSRAGTHIEGCPRGCSTGGIGRDNTLRVMSLNILHGHPDFEDLTRRLDLVGEEIRRQDPDIVCLQEVPWTWKNGSSAAHLSQITGYNYVYLRANGNRSTIFFEEGLVILSRYPLENLSFKELEPRAGFFEHRVVLHATALSPWGNVDVFVTHLTNGDPGINREQAMALQVFVSQTGADLSVISGDFNAREGSPQIESLSQVWVDAYRQAKPQGDGGTCCIEDLTKGPGDLLEKRIDYIFISTSSGVDAKVSEAYILFDEPYITPSGWLWASDHAGLVVDLAVVPKE